MSGRKTWLWLVVPGVFLIVVGLIAWQQGDAPFWYVLLGISNVVIGLTLRNRQR